MRMYCHTGSFSSINQMVFDFPKIYVEAPRPVLVLELWITVAFVQCYKDLTIPEHGVVEIKIPISRQCLFHLSRVALIYIFNNVCAMENLPLNLVLLQSLSSLLTPYPRWGYLIPSFKSTDTSFVEVA